jgi:arabinoxylan arabinofuranohydrolase
MLGAPQLLLLLLTALPAALAANPLVANVGQADPHIHFWPEANSFFLYSTHDFSPNNTGFRMDDWRVWSSPDLRTWQLADTVFPNATPSNPGDYHNCWATDGAHKKEADGSFSYFFYLSIGTCQVAVLKSTATPAGPWQNILGTPLLNASFGNSLSPKACFRDPAVFEDDDGAHYLISGVFDYYIMRLGDDLVSIAEQPRYVTIVNPTGPYGNRTDDKPFIHKANGLYYLSWGCFYGTSTSVYGPYTYVGSAIDTAFLAPDFRMNQTGGPWYSHEDYQDRHGSFWTNGAGQAFYASNDRSHSLDATNPGVFRDTVIGYVHYYANNSIAPVAIDATGVGEYRAAHVEAENFMELAGAGASKQHLPARGDAFAVAVRDARGAALRFPHVSGAGATLALVAANAGARSVVVVARRGAAAGSELARCAVAPSGGAFARTACALALAGGDADDLDLVLTFEDAEGKGSEPLALLLDSFSLVDVE